MPANLPPRSLEGLVYVAEIYDHHNYYKRVPLALHPLWQLVPIVGNVVVFVQTCQFIRQVNTHVRVPYRERIETWISIIIMLVIGMVPILGLVLTMYCTNCSDYLAIAIHHKTGNRIYPLNASVASLTERKSGTSLKRKHNNNIKNKNSPGDLERGLYENTVATASDGSLVIVSHANTEPSAAESSSQVAACDTVKAVAAPKTKAKGVKRSKSAGSQPVSKDNTEEPPATQRTPSVFGRISKLSWMEDVMALSPTDNNRTSFSNLALTKGTEPQTHYADIHDLATRNSRMGLALPASSSLQNLPSYFKHTKGSSSNTDLKAMVDSRRMTRSLHIGNDVLDKLNEEEEKDSKTTDVENKLLKRPDYSRFESGAKDAHKRSSSLFGLAPSPQQPATADK
ncbi:hypothetical protein EV175_002589 [Coemansia sp. RSA 1933]|nr:hypothetical protein EV175_002589 [Coemansia sp. RSA 1933]